MRFTKKWSDRRRVRKLARQWRQFRSAMDTELGSPKPPSKFKERRFLGIQSGIAKSVPVLNQVYGRRSLEQESQAAGRDMTELMHRVSKLSDVKGLGGAAREEILREWHVLFIFLQKLEGTMTGSIEDGVMLADGSAIEGRAMSQFAQTAPKRESMGVVGFLNRVLVFALLALVVGAVFGIDGDDITRFVRGEPTAPPAGIESAVEQGDGAAMAQAPTGETEVPAPAAPHFPAAFRMPRLVQPVVNRYGAAGVLVLGGALLVGTLALFRLRTR